MYERLQSSLLVTGASGHLGRRVVELLLEAGARNIVAASRDPDKLAELVAKGAQSRKVDFDDPGTLDVAFTNIERILIVSTDAIFVPGKRLQQHKAAVDAAAKAGVKHIVYTSMPNPEPPSRMAIAADHYGTEQAIEKSGVGFTILRNCWYADNFFRSLPAVLASGKWFTCAGEGRMPYVSRADIARAAAAALACETTENKRHDITGLERLTTAEIAAIVSEVFGKKIEVVHLSEEEFAKALIARGTPEAWVPGSIATESSIRAGKFDITSDAIKHLTGREPQSLRDFFIANKTAFMPGG
ncbi:MAG: SDR family oxidoreductase [Steroidobacteraceae bacterium]